MEKENKRRHINFMSDVYFESEISVLLRLSSYQPVSSVRPIPRLYLVLPELFFNLLCKLLDLVRLIGITGQNVMSFLFQ